MQTGIDRFIERVSKDKGIHKNHFLEWKGYITSLLDQKIILLFKITCRPVKSMLRETRILKFSFRMEIRGKYLTIA